MKKNLKYCYKKPGTSFWAQEMQQYTEYRYIMGKGFQPFPNEEANIMKNVHNFICEVDVTKKANDCPSGFILWENSCYSLITHNTDTWDEAKKYCKALPYGTNPVTNAKKSLIWTQDAEIMSFEKEGVTKLPSDDFFRFVQSVLIRNLEYSNGLEQGSYKVWVDDGKVVTSAPLTVKGLVDRPDFDEVDEETDTPYFICKLEKAIENKPEELSDTINFSPQTRSLFLHGQEGYPWRGESGTCKCFFGPYAFHLMSPLFTNAHCCLFVQQVGRANVANISTVP